MVRGHVDKAFALADKRGPPHLGNTYLDSVPTTDGGDAGAASPVTRRPLGVVASQARRSSTCRLEVGAVTCAGRTSRRRRCGPPIGPTVSANPVPLIVREPPLASVRGVVVSWQEPRPRDGLRRPRLSATCSGDVFAPQNRAGCWQSSVPPDKTPTRAVSATRNSGERSHRPPVPSSRRHQPARGAIRASAASAR